jgi:hypothetical protein
MFPSEVHAASRRGIFGFGLVMVLLMLLICSVKGDPPVWR